MKSGMTSTPRSCKAGRTFGLISTALLLIVLVVEMAQMYAGALTAAVSARNYSDIARHNHASSASALPLGNQPDTFIHRENVARYRARLANDALDPSTRQTLERLLAEEAKFPNHTGVG